MMLTVNILFYFVGIVLISCSILVIIADQLMLSLIALIGSFLSAAFLLFILECEFLALIFLIVYVGAMTVLFLYAVMMIESKSNNFLKKFKKDRYVSFIFSIPVIYYFLILIINSNDRNYCDSLFLSKYQRWYGLIDYITDLLNLNDISYCDSLFLSKYQNWYDLVDSITDLEIFGQILYSYFALQLLISGLILLLVLVGVVYLTRDSTFRKFKSRSVFKRSSRNFKIFFK